MDCMADYVSGGLIDAAGPDEDDNPGPPPQPRRRPARQPRRAVRQRIEAAASIEDLTASYQGGWYSVTPARAAARPRR